MDANKVVLYDFFDSNSAWRVRNVLYWKSIPFDTVSVNLMKGEQKSEEFGKLNPINTVPVLFIDGHYITQSVAICEYLEETRPEHPIFPTNSLDRARVRQIVEIINSYMVPLQNPATAQRASKEVSEQTAWSLEFFQKGFTALEHLISKTSGKYCVGDIVTFADMCLIGLVWRTKRFNPDPVNFPSIFRIYDELLKLPTFRLAHAASHRDCPPGLKDTLHLPIHFHDNPG
ncbi:maleylacetoacetate isomerase-like [Paramacrobiotus metropolitanus]|uniref:maleylacetoacetate isomerase-like n=1 Tax=Paramacrobiotus metropolitanus TaxID=2943436 RepID=UPI002445D8A0|nr:maleylacetoacetate isomerase-like [Paramacrobiotus metropolitanus]